MCGSLLSKFKCGNRVAPAHERDSLETAKDMARLKRKQAEELAIQKKVDEILAKEKLAREKLQTKNLAKEGFVKDRRGIEKRVKQEVVMREKLKAEKASSRARPRFIVLDEAKSAIAFDVVVGRKWKRTVLLSARAPRKLHRLDSPPPVTTELLAAKQLAVRERRLKELERV